MTEQTLTYYEKRKRIEISNWKKRPLALYTRKIGISVYCFIYFNGKRTLT